MSYGLTPYELVQQVYYVQEKVILDFHPKDDKYREVIMEANLVLQELQKEEDWTWLRERLVLGPCWYQRGEDIPEFQLPQWVYKPSTLYGDCVKLVAQDCHERLIESDFIEVPYSSAGAQHHRRRELYGKGPGIYMPDTDLRAVVYGDTLTFNRPFRPHEANRVAVTDVQHRIEQLHICDDSCPDENCPKIEKRVLMRIPDPNYVIVKTACKHAEGSPPAQGRLVTLQDEAQKLLSAMRQNDASATDPDYMEWDTFNFVTVM